MARYKGTIIAGIQPIDYTGSQLYEMSRTHRSNHLMSANKTLRYQLMWNGLNEGQSPNKSRFNSSSNKGDIINVVFDIYATTISPPPADIAQWNLVSSIKKTRDIANKSYLAGQPSLAQQRFTVDIASVCQDVLSYSLVPIKKGTWQSSVYGGMNGGASKQDNVTQSISSYNVSENGAFRHIWVHATPEVILANGTIAKASQNAYQFNKICVINSLAQFELDNPYYYASFLIGQYGVNSAAARGFMSFCPNKTTQSGAATTFLKNVRTDEEAEWLYWYQYKLFNNNEFTIPATDKVYNSVTKARIKINTYSGSGILQNTCYLSDFNSNLATEVKANLTVFKQSQSVLCAQNVSPAYINLYAQDDSGNLLINQIDDSTIYYKAALEYETAEDNLVINGNFDTDSNWTKGTGWAIANGKANATSASSDLFQIGVPFSLNKTYKLTYTISNYSQGNTRAILGGYVVGGSRNTNGTFTDILTPTNVSSNSYVYIEGQSGFTGSIDNVSLQENPTTLRATEYRFFNIDRENVKPAYGFVRFHWLNRAGGIDSYTAKRNITEGLSVEKSIVEIKSADRTWVQNQYTNANTLTLHDPTAYHSNTMRGGNLYKGGREVLGVNANRTNSVYTEPLNKDSSNWLQEIITSPNVWIEMDTPATKRNNTLNPYQRPSTKEYIPVIINNTDVETLNQELGLVKFNIEYTLAHKVQTQRN